MNVIDKFETSEVVRSSAGRLDLVPATLERLGVERLFHKVRVKPGKPLWFGIGPPRGTEPRPLVFGLPGNPVSSLVGFLLFVRPALRVLAGHADPGPRSVMLPLAEAISETNDRPTYRPAKREPAEVGWAVRPLPWAGAPDLRGMMHADGLIVLPAGDARYEAGTAVEVVLTGEPAA